MKDRDLTEIPEKFHILFKSDWNCGNDSTMKMEDRIDCEQLYLEYNKWAIKTAIAKNNSTKEPEIQQGFIKD